MQCVAIKVWNESKDINWYEWENLGKMVCYLLRGHWELLDGRLCYLLTLFLCWTLPWVQQKKSRWKIILKSLYVPRFPQPNFDTVFSGNVLLCCTERIACSRAGAEQWANNPAELDRSHSHLDPSKKMYNKLLPTLHRFKTWRILKIQTWRLKYVYFYITFHLEIRFSHFFNPIFLLNILHWS